MRNRKATLQVMLEIVLAAIVGSGIALGLLLLLFSQGSSSSHKPVPVPAATGSYSTKGLPEGNACHHSGPGWMVIPGETAREVFQVKDVYYCAGIITGAAVIPVRGAAFDLFAPFTFSKTREGNP